MNRVAILKGRYQIVKILHSGVFGKTYVAKDTYLPSHPQCLVKQLDFSSYDSQLLLEIGHFFEKDAKTLEKLGEHPQIPKLSAYFEENKKFYIVQELIPGKSLENEIIADRTWPENQVISLLTEVLEILVFIHQNNAIHGNIKPDNLIRCESDGKLVLLNLEAVKEIDTQLGNKKIGTPGYMPREQKEGNPKPCSDIYALGAIAVQACTGKLPNELLKNDRGIVWRERAQISPKLADAIDLMVRENWQERYQSAQEVLVELKKIRDRRSSTITVYNPAVPSRKKFRSLKKVRIAAVVTVVAGMIATYTAYNLGKLEATQGSDAQLLQKSETALTQRNYEECLKQAKIIVKGSNYHSKAQNAIEKCRNGVNWQNVEVQTFKEHSDKVWDVAFSPDKKTFATSSRDQTIKIWDWPTMNPIVSLEKGHSHSVLSLAFSPDSKLLASSGADMKVNVWKPRTSQIILTSWHNKRVWSVAISSANITGKIPALLASGSEDRSIKVWNLETGTQLPDYKLPGSNRAHSSIVYSVAFSPDGKTLVSGSADKTIKIWDLLNSKQPRILKGHSDAVKSIAIGPNSQIFVSGSWDKTIKVWNLKAVKEITTLRGHSDKVMSVAIGPDGKTLASASADQTIKIWDLQSGKLLNTLKGHSGEVVSVAFSPDGKAIASGSVDNTFKIWRR